MEVLICGLNSYLGRGSVEFFKDEAFNIHGIVRDKNLFLSKTNLTNHQNIYQIDIFKNEGSQVKFDIPNLELAFYFTQVPDIGDLLALQYELVSLRNYIRLCQQRGCNRLIYIGRTYDKKYLDKVRELLVEMDVDYTIVLKDVALGMSTYSDYFIREITKHKYVFLFDPNKGTTRFRPFVLNDIFRWLKEIPWKQLFIREEIEFGGIQTFELKEVFHFFMKRLEIKKGSKIVFLKNRCVAHWLNRAFYGTRYDIYNEYILHVSRGQYADNSKWQSKINFEYTPIHLI